MKKLIALLLLCPLTGLFGQATTGFHRVNQIIARIPQGGVYAQVVPNATITITNTASPTTLATIYSDPLLTSQITPPTVFADNNGNYSYYIPLNYCVTENISSPGQGLIVIPNICANGSGGGSGVGPGTPPFAAVFGPPGTVVGSSTSVQLATLTQTVSGSSSANSALFGLFTESGADNPNSFSGASKAGYAFTYNSAAGGIYNNVATANLAVYNSGSTYIPGQLIKDSGGQPWQALQLTTGNAPSAGVFWQQVQPQLKSNREAVQDIQLTTTLAQNFAFALAIQSWSNGEADGISVNLGHAGGFEANGNEYSTGFRDQLQQIPDGYCLYGSSNSGLWAGTVGTVGNSSTGISTVSFTSLASTSYPCGTASPIAQGAILRDLSRSVTGTGYSVSGSTITLTSPSPSLTSVFPVGSNYTVWQLTNSGATSASDQMLAVDAIFEDLGPVGSNGAYGSASPYTVAVQGVTDGTHITFSTCVPVSQCSGFWQALALEQNSANERWAIYPAAIVQSVNTAAGTFTTVPAVNPATSPIQNGDSLDQPLNGGTGLAGIEIVERTTVGVGPDNLEGVDITNNSLLGTTDANSAPQAGAGVKVTGDYGSAFVVNLTHPATSAQVQNGIFVVNWPNTGLMSTPTTLPSIISTQTYYPLIGPWLAKDSNGNLNFGNVLATPETGVNVNPTTGNTYISGLLTSPYGSWGFYGNQMLCSVLQSSCNSDWTVLQSVTVNPNTNPAGVLTPYQTSAAEQIVTTLNTASTQGLQQNFSVTVGQTYQASVFLYADSSNSATLLPTVNISVTSGGGSCASSPLVTRPLLPPGAGWILYTTLPCVWTGSSGTAHFAFGIAANGGVNPPIGSIYYAYLPAVVNTTNGNVQPVFTSASAVSGFGATAAGQVLAATAQPVVWSANSSASTPAVSFIGSVFTGGSGSTTQPFMYFDQGTAPTSWNTNGTYIGINQTSGGTADFLNFYVNGTDEFKVSSSGTVFGVGLENLATAGNAEFLASSTGPQLVTTVAGNSALINNSNASPTADLLDIQANSVTVARFDKLGNLTVPSCTGCVLVGTITFTTATSDSATITGVTSSSHCVAFPTNATAAASTVAAFISGVTANTVTFTHVATSASGGTENIHCTIN